MKKIIFGAGNYGKLAVKNIGEENIAYFVDNDENKCGSVFCGKDIISYSSYLKIRDEYQIVIATKYYAPISEQLRNSGISKYEYFLPQFERMRKEIKENIINTDKNIVLLGIDDSVELVLHVLKEIGINALDIKLADKQSSKSIGDSILGYDVRSITEIKEPISKIIISSEPRTFALQVYANRLFGEEKPVVNPFIQKKYYSTNEIIFSPYDDNKHERTEEDWIEIVNNNPDVENINEYVDELAISQPLFEHVEIETINRCNGGCEFCPVNVKNDIRKEQLMDEMLFQKIIDELSDLNYSGRLALFSNNEPFLDPRIIEFNQYARKMLPNARMHLFTNGTLLDLEKFIRIIGYLDELIIDNYNQELRLIDNSKQIKEYCEEHPELREKVTIVLRRPREILTSRGGDAPNRIEKISYLNIKCALPFKQLIVRPDGKVSLCCNDPYGKYTMGDLSKNSILDVWHGEEFVKIRKKIQKGRGNVDHCVFCDTFIMY